MARGCDPRACLAIGGLPHAVFKYNMRCLEISRGIFSCVAFFFWSLSRFLNLMPMVVIDFSSVACLRVSRWFGQRTQANSLVIFGVDRRRWIVLIIFLSLVSNGLLLSNMAGGGGRRRPPGFL